MGQYIPITLGNIAPLALKPFRPGRLALVCEGGGQRGIFTAGVLDEFMQANFNPFDLYFGTSAGAQNLSAYVCNQPGYARKVIMRYTTTRDFFDPVRFVRGGNLIDLDWLVDSTSRQMPLAMDFAARSFDAGKAFYMCACRQDDYTAEYFAPTHQTWLDLIRASSAIPGFYRSGVSLNGVNYFDGGVSDAIPVQEAAKRGAKTIVVIRTVPSQTYYTPQWFKRMERWLGDSSLQPLVNLVQHHEKSYSAIQRFIETPPGKLRILEIYPPKLLHSMALGSRLPALRDDYKIGRLCGRYFLATVGKLLAETPPLIRHTVVPAPLIVPPEVVAAPVPATRVVPPAAVANDLLDAPLVNAVQANDLPINKEDTA
ncbi:UNVERIFIED_ORG: putative patatin/cPLA2 family phospholipase [Kosakonia oryzae]|uniref:Predicted phospholipase, patatin/cPLA2 family n=1 Tax=Kosakonia radicincitans TaxID=283686 RepID=A0AAX2ESR3_9ENTR|nr:patatin family protein [Kosakonia radicincitans]MDP9566401.1 putative patatin/cPLA2 family phospholipase [Kosakonia oryzae]MDD7998223.1 patatin family protein [Kosakonia radicincitans]SFE56472.1 Predicted phospholipase, patatin/cPLA2 family [Kosakonia radicincitans]SFR14108.1 Predicted phospholipase, patatin/cPLA2 family [Kosakonia radicincitans]SFU05223.1 Predicted phospholipase, patatin/cPLA2 family [Kosakonia radicincitans]